MNNWKDFLNAVLDGNIKTQLPEMLMRMDDNTIYLYVTKIRTGNTPDWVAQAIYNEAEERGLI